MFKLSFFSLPSIYVHVKNHDIQFTILCCHHVWYNSLKKSCIVLTTRSSVYPIHKIVDCFGLDGTLNINLFQCLITSQGQTPPKCNQGPQMM